MKYIMITGATSGIGEVTARYMNRYEDVSFVLVGRNEKKLEQLASELGKETFYVVCDLAVTEGIETCFLACKERNIKLDGLVHCAGIGENMPIRNIQTQHVERLYRVHAMAFTELGKNFSKKKYSNDGASVVVMSSQAAFEMEKGMAAYASSKAAVNALVKVMAKEFLGRRIRVNGIAPAFVATPMIQEEMVRWEKEESMPQPMGVIPPEQIAYLIDFLVSEKASYITGEIIQVSAGMIF